MTICQSTFVLKDGNTYYRVKFLCTAEIRGASKSHPITRHYSVSVDDSCIKTEYRTTENPTIVKAQYFVTKHIKQIQCIS